MSIVLLEQATDSEVFGGKAYHLGAARSAGLPVPPGFALGWGALAALVQGDAAAVADTRRAFEHLGPPVAARSSAVGEDGADASFAGQHATILNLTTAAAVLDGLARVHASAHAESALAYRRKKGITAPIRIGAVVQKLVDPECAGVLFTRNPVTGADEYVIEAAWGLGEIVVAGLVTPDHYRVGRDGRTLEVRQGEKDIAIARSAGGGTEEVPVPSERVHARCLDDAALSRVVALAARCEAHFGANLDLEWAFAENELYLLQARPISTRRP